MDQWTYGPMDQWTNGPMDQWTNGSMDQWTNEPMDQESDRRNYCDPMKRKKHGRKAQMLKISKVGAGYILAHHHYKSSCRS